MVAVVVVDAVVVEAVDESLIVTAERSRTKSLSSHTPSFKTKTATLRSAYIKAGVVMMANASFRMNKLPQPMQPGRFLVHPSLTGPVKEMLRERIGEMQPRMTRLMTGAQRLPPQMLPPLVRTKKEATSSAVGASKRRKKMTIQSHSTSILLRRSKQFLISRS